MVVVGLYVGQADGSQRAELDALSAARSALQLHPHGALLVSAAVDSEQRASQQLRLLHPRHDVQAGKLALVDFNLCNTLQNTLTLNFFLLLERAFLPAIQ